MAFCWCEGLHDSHSVVQSSAFTSYNFSSIAVQVFQIAVTSTYGVAEFKENLLALYTKAGVKGNQVTFLITDNQIINEGFLVYINDFLSTGSITDLCSPVSRSFFRAYRQYWERGIAFAFMLQL